MVCIWVSVDFGRAGLWGMMIIMRTSENTEVVRRWLTRGWVTPGATHREVVWVMLNPSTADAATDDPTIRRVRGFTERAGYTAFTVVNLTPVRATKPKDLSPELIAEHHQANMDYVRGLCIGAEVLVAAWGASPLVRVGSPLHQCAKTVLDFHGVVCLGKTKQGHPRHPLYVPSTQALVPFHDHDV